MAAIGCSGLLAPTAVQGGGLSPLRQGADVLTGREWPRLYDRDVLADNEVPVAALICAEDPYVERVFSEDTAAHIRGARTWLTNEDDHNALRADGERGGRRVRDLPPGRA